MLPRQTPRAMRSLLCTPGNNPGAFAEVFNAGADAVVFELDEVPTAEKEATRLTIVRALQGARRMHGYVRVNAFNTRHCIADLDAVIGPWLDGILLPMTESREALQAVAQRMSRSEERAGLPAGKLELIALVQTAKGVLQAHELACATARLRYLAFDAAHYSRELELEWSANEEELAYARAQLTHAARAAGIEPPLDTPVLPSHDAERFLQSARNARRMGFQGKLCTRAQQVKPCHEVFTPAPAEVDAARRVLEDFAQSQALGSTARLTAEVIDPQTVRNAQRTLARAARDTSKG